MFTLELLLIESEHIALAGIREKTVCLDKIQ